MLGKAFPGWLLVWLIYLVIRIFAEEHWAALPILLFPAAVYGGAVSTLAAPGLWEGRGWVRVAAAVTMVQLGFGAMQIAGVDPLFSRAAVAGLEGRLPGGFAGHHTFFGLLCAWLAFFWLWRRNYVFALLCAAGVLLTKSAFAGASLVYGLLWFLYCRGKKKLAVLAGSVLLIVGASLFIDSEKPSDFFFHNGRLPIWVYAVNALAERPWLGYGVGEFSKEFPAYHQVLRDKRWEEAHNELIEYVFNTGLVGLLALLPLMIAVLVRLWRIPRSPAKELAVGTLIMLGVNAMGNFPLQIAPFATGAIYALAWILRPLPEDTPPEHAGKP